MGIEQKGGGPAYPVQNMRVPSPIGLGECDFSSLGISVRDYFAGQALAGMLARDEIGIEENRAEQAYMLADAMLLERSKAGA